MRSLPLTTPLAVLAGGAVLVYLIARRVTRRNRVLAGATALLFAVALITTLPVMRQAAAGEFVIWPTNGEARVLLAEPGGMLIAATALVLGLGVAIYSGEYLALDRRPDRYYPLLLLMLAGTVGMTLAADIFTLYLFVVLTNASSYVLVAFRRGTETAIEAGFKYAVTSSMGSIMMLAGIGFVFRSSGTLTLPIQAPSTDGWYLLGIAFIAFGLIVKAALFPAHVWLPDAHGRAPSSVSALLSGIIVPVHLYVLVKLGPGLGVPHPVFGWIIVGLASGSMLVGNVMALRQTYGKRLLGYSTVAQVGYMAMSMGLGLAYQRPEPIAAGLLLLVAHALLKGMAFLSKGILHFYCDATRIDDLDGLGRRAPFASGHLAAGLIGLAGVPPLVGFAAKFGILWGMAGIGRWEVWVVAGLYLVNSFVSLGYYLPLVGRLMRSDTSDKPAAHPSAWMQVPVAVMGLTVLLLGIWPTPVWDLAQQAARFLIAWGR